MTRFLAAAGLLMSGSAAFAAPASTDFGIRTAPGQPTTQAQPAAATSPVNLSSAAAFASRWGQVTSTRRSRARNAAVGGVRNSFHLSGRAIDIVRRRGVSHAQLDSAFRRAGYHLIESLDEGDHSHFAFGWAGRASATPARQQREERTRWRIVTAANVTAR